MLDLRKQCKVILMIRLKNITVEMKGEPLFEQVSFILHRGDRVGLVGPNGSGKTTLLRVLTGSVEPEQGEFAIEGEQVGYLPQETIFAPEATITSFLSSTPAQIVEPILKEVGLGAVPPSFLVADLSGGQKTRLVLARVLGTKPSVLLLDEPTNHLDIHAIEWLEQLINSFRGAVLIVSHDRRLLDNTVDKILEIDPVNKSWNEYVGGYTEYTLERARRMEKQEGDYNRQQKEKKRLELWLARKREEAKIYADPRKGKMIRAMEKRLEREIYSQEIVTPRSTRKISHVTLDGEVAASKLVLRAKYVRKSFAGKSVLWDVSFEMRGREHVLLAGKNGSGKTTLLQLLLGELKPDEGEVRIGDNMSIGYFAQEHETLDPEKTVIDEYLATARLLSPEDEARHILGSFLFSGDAVFKKVSTLSLGERVRLMFAKLTHQKNELLILDEPTNHLDVTSREVIEAALADYEGAILAVSHDRYFIDKLGFTRTLTLEQGVLV